MGKYFRDLWIIFIAALSSCLGFALLSHYFQPRAVHPTEDVDIFILVGIFLGVTLCLGALILWRLLTRKAARTASLHGKLEGFKTSYLLLLLMLEGASILNFAFYIIEGLSANFFMAAGILFLLGSRFPSRTVITNMLRLSNQEQIYLHKEDHILF